MGEKKNIIQTRRCGAVPPQHDTAVSPVVGVMLMLVVVIVIAAVVSGFAGGLMTGTKSAPRLSMDVHIQNNGNYANSFFKAEVTGVDAPVRTRDLKLVTSWSSKGTGSTTIYHGGAVVVPGTTNFNVTYPAESGQSATIWKMVAPQGDGPSVGFYGNETANGKPYEGTATTMADIGVTATNYTWFGNYNLQAGTVMYARPFGGKYDGKNFSVGYVGFTSNNYWKYYNGTDSSGAVFDAGTSTDQMQAVLGQNWNILRPGDIVSVKVIHIPSGKTIWQADVPVEGAVI